MEVLDTMPMNHDKFTVISKILTGSNHYKDGNEIFKYGHYLESVSLDVVRYFVEYCGIDPYSACIPDCSMLACLITHTFNIGNEGFKGRKALIYVLSRVTPSDVRSGTFIFMELFYRLAGSAEGYIYIYTTIFKYMPEDSIRVLYDVLERHSNLKLIHEFAKDPSRELILTLPWRENKTFIYNLSQKREQWIKYLRRLPLIGTSRDCCLLILQFLIINPADIPCNISIPPGVPPGV